MNSSKVLVTGLILTVSVLFIVIGKEEETVTEIQKSDSKYCLSSECVKVAAAIISDLDDETDPCDDFYKVSISEFTNHHLVICRQCSDIVRDSHYHLLFAKSGNGNFCILCHNF